LAHATKRHPTPAQMETIVQQLEEAKQRLSVAQTEYAHCFARGDFAECGKAKRKVAKHMKEVQFLVAQKLATR
jgi:putative hemolysin